MALLHKAGGGIAGTGGTVALRRLGDTADGPVLMQPSVLYGLGTGVLGTGVWLAGSRRMVNVPPGVADFFQWHGVTALASGLVSAGTYVNAGNSLL